jgi:hypothetical protein
MWRFAVRDYARRESNNPAETRQKREGRATTVHQTAHFPPDLQSVIDAWPDLPGAIKATVLALVGASK